MSRGAVCALVGAHPAHPGAASETRAAVGAQDRPCDHVVDVRGGDLGSGLVEALATGATWIWLLDGVTVPRADALAALDDAQARLEGLPAPLVLASRVLDGAGAMHPDALPRHEIFEKQLTVDAIERGLVQLRATPAGSVLVHRDALTRFAPPRDDLPPAWSVFDFTARVLQSWADTGYLVPQSVATRRLPPRPAGRAGGDLRTRARLLAGGAWTSTERLWEGFLVAEAALRAARG